MEYENVDKDIRYLTACENVKKIVNAIKSIKIKYYPNFSKISDKDKKAYEQLQENLEKISKENNLSGLKVALMDEVSAKYDKKDINNQRQQENPNDVDNRLQACYGAIDVQINALSHGRIKQATKCQEILKKYLEEIDSMSYRELVVNYKREKLDELIRNKDKVQERNESWMQDMKGFCIPEDVKERKVVKEKIEEARTNLITLFNDSKPHDEKESEEFSK